MYMYVCLLKISTACEALLLLLNLLRCFILEHVVMVYVCSVTLILPLLVCEWNCDICKKATVHERKLKVSDPSRVFCS